MADAKGQFDIDMSKVKGLGDRGEKATKDLIAELKGGGALGAAAAFAVDKTTTHLPGLVANAAFAAQAGLMDKNGIVGEQRTEFNLEMQKIRAFSAQVAAQLNRLDLYEGDELVYERTIPPIPYFRKVSIIGNKKTSEGIFPSIDTMGRVQVRFDGFEADRKSIESEMEKDGPTEVLHQKAYDLVYLTLAPLLSDDVAKRLREALDKPGDEKKELDPIVVIARNMYIGVYEKLERMFPPGPAFKYLDSLQESLTAKERDLLPVQRWQPNLEFVYIDASGQVKGQNPVIHMNFPTGMRLPGHLPNFPTDFDFDLEDLVDHDFTKTSKRLGFDNLGGVVEKPEIGPIQLFNKEIFEKIFNKFVTNNATDWAVLSDLEKKGFKSYLQNILYRLFLKYIDPQQLLKQKYLVVIEKDAAGHTLEETQALRDLMVDQNRTARERAQANIFNKAKVSETSPQDVQFSTPAFNAIAQNLKKNFTDLGIKDGKSTKPSQIVVVWPLIRSDLIKLKKLSEANPDPTGPLADLYKFLSNLMFESGYIKPAGGVNDLQAQVEENIDMLVELVRNIIPRLVGRDIAQIQFMQGILTKDNLLSNDIPIELSSMEGYRLIVQIQDSNLNKDNPEQAHIIDTVAGIFNLPKEMFAKAEVIQQQGQGKKNRDYKGIETVEEALDKFLLKGIPANPALPNGNRAVYLAAVRRRMQTLGWRELNKNKTQNIDDLGQLIEVVGDGTQEQKKIAQNVMKVLEDVPMVIRVRIVSSLGTPFSNSNIRENLTNKNSPLPEYFQVLKDKLIDAKKDSTPIDQLTGYVPPANPSPIQRRAALELLTIWADEPLDFKNNLIFRLGQNLFEHAQEEIVDGMNLPLLAVSTNLDTSIKHIETQFAVYISTVRADMAKIRTDLDNFVDGLETYESLHPGAHHPQDAGFDPVEHGLAKIDFGNFDFKTRLGNESREVSNLLGQLQLDEFDQTTNPTLRRIRESIDMIKKWGKPTLPLDDMDNELINMQNELANFRRTTGTNLKNELLPISERINLTSNRLRQIDQEYQLS